MVGGAGRLDRGMHLLRPVLRIGKVEDEIPGGRIAVCLTTNGFPSAVPGARAVLEGERNGAV